MCNSKEVTSETETDSSAAADNYTAALAKAIIIASIGVAVGVWYLFYAPNLPYPTDTSGVLEITILSWLGLGLAALLVLILIIYPEVFKGSFEKLFGGGNNNDFNPKGIFDHIRNYFIIGTLFYLGMTPITSEAPYISALRVTYFALSLVFISINFMHGKRAISKFLDQVIASSKLDGRRLKIWKSGFPKLPAYTLLPILALTTVLHAHMLFR